ncbi:twin-arginine translocation pathway signal [Nocardia sp. NPDC058379]|uniref:twin-arginine translocation pathway signal n=1 Tax=unclassified Nocardia TaxID=2637762 RepID=UPI003648D4C8
MSIIRHVPPLSRRRTALALCAIAALVAVFGWAYLAFVIAARDTAAGPTRQQAAVDAATNATVAILSYGSDTVDTDLKRAGDLLTGSFADYYSSFTRDVVIPAAKEKKIDTSATVVGKAITEFSEDRAAVLVFLNQSTKTVDIAEPTTTSTTVRIEMERHGTTWLVAKFDPA